MHKKILVIDDNQPMTMLMDYILQFEGYDVTCQLCGKKGLENMKTLDPDLIILDWIMPNFSGEDVLVQKHQDPLISPIPTILLTGLAESITLNTDKHGCIIQIIEKPFDHDFFIKTIKETLS